MENRIRSSIKENTGTVLILSAIVSIFLALGVYFLPVGNSLSSELITALSPLLSLSLFAAIFIISEEITPTKELLVIFFLIVLFGISSYSTVARAYSPPNNEVDFFIHGSRSGVDQTLVKVSQKPGRFDGFLKLSGKEDQLVRVSISGNGCNLKNATKGQNIRLLKFSDAYSTYKVHFQCSEFKNHISVRTLNNSGTTESPIRLALSSSWIVFDEDDIFSDEKKEVSVQRELMSSTMFVKSDSGFLTASYYPHIGILAVISTFYKALTFGLSVALIERFLDYAD